MSIFQIIDPNKKLLWTSGQRLSLKILAVFFILLTVPLDWKFYRDIFSLDWSGVNFTHIFELSRYFPRIVNETPHLADIFIVLFISLLIAWIWHRYDKQRVKPEKLYYYLLVLVRYRLSFGLVAYAFLKLFPILAPYPSLTLLNTPYGDLSAWKIFNLSIGIVPDYQAFLGFWELLAALLLLHRKTASIGAFIAILFLGNVAMSNLAYEGGEFIYAGALTLYALLLFGHDLPRYFNILFIRKRTLPNTIRPDWEKVRGFHWAKLAKGLFYFHLYFSLWISGL